MTHKISCLSFILFMTILLLLPLNCKKQSTTPDPPPPSLDNEISLSCSPSSGGKGTTVSVTISIKGNLVEMKAFGLELTFDPNVFKYQSTITGSLTGSWASVDGNEVNAGNLVVGGFMGSGTPVVIKSQGSLAIVKFEVIYAGTDDGFTRQITIKNYIDGLKGMKPEPSSTTFTFKKSF
jgi:hypothetical protein